MLFFFIKWGLTLKLNLCFTTDMLEEIIKQYDSKAAFCRAIGIKPQYLRQIEIGRKLISPKMALAIHEKHSIPLHEMRPDIYPEPKKAVNE